MIPTNPPDCKRCAGAAWAGWPRRQAESLRRGLRDAAATHSDDHEAETGSEQQHAGRFGDNLKRLVGSHDAPEFEGRCWARKRGRGEPQRRTDDPEDASTRTLSPIAGEARRQALKRRSRYRAAPIIERQRIRSIYRAPQQSDRILRGIESDGDRARACGEVVPRIGGIEG